MFRKSVLESIQKKEYNTNGKTLKLFFFPPNINQEHFNWCLSAIFQDQKGQNGVLPKAFNMVAVVGLYNLAQR